MASTCKRDESLHSSRQLPHFTPTLIDRARERPCRDIYSYFQSRSNIVNVCLVLRMGSQPRGSRYVEEMVSDGTGITYQSVGTQCSGVTIQRQRQIQTYLIVDSTVIQLIIQQWSPTSIAREEKICSHARNDMDDSTLMSLLGCTASKSTQSWERM